VVDPETKAFGPHPNTNARVRSKAGEAGIMMGYVFRVLASLERFLPRGTRRGRVAYVVPQHG
jgi:hypothetical protein